MTVDSGLAKEIGEATAVFLSREGYPGRLRTGADPRALTGQVAELGLTGVLAAEDAGGIGGGAAEWVAVFRAVGAGLLPLPLAESAAGAAVLGTHPAVAQVVAGEALLAVAAGPAEVLFDGGRLTGRARLVDGGDGADLYLVAARTKAYEQCLVLAGNGAGVRATALRSTDPAYRPADVDFAGTPATVLATGAEATRGLRWLTTAVRAAHAAELTGIAERLVSLAVAYAGEREQFGRPIGAFQAVKHLAADAHTDAYAMDSLCLRLAGLDLASAEADRWADSAKAHCSRAGVRVAETVLQILGGIGFTAEHDLALYYPRVLTLADRWGHPEQLEHAIGAAALTAAREGSRA